MTDEANVRLSEALEAERAVGAKGAAALARKAKNSLPGDDDLVEAWAQQKIAEAKVKLGHARMREVNGKATKADATLFKSKLVKTIEQAEATCDHTPFPTPRPPRACPKSKRQRKRKRIVESAGDSDVEDDVPSETEVVADLAEDEYLAEEIRDGPDEHGKYEVKWDGYESDKNTWEPLSHLPRMLLREYLDKKFDDDEVPLTALAYLNSE